MQVAYRRDGTLSASSKRRESQCKKTVSTDKHDTGSQQGETGERYILAIWMKGSMHVVRTDSGSESEVEVWGGTLAEDFSQWDSLMGTACSQRWTSRL